MNQESGHTATTVAVIEDHEDLRNGLGLTIRTAPGFELAGTYESCEQFLSTPRIRPPQVVLMDIGLPGMSGIEGVRVVKERFAGIHVIMLSVYEDDGRVFEAICAGAGGYLLKKSTPSEILQAIGLVVAGGVPMTPGIAQKVIRAFREIYPRPAPDTDLTPREHEILRSLVDGLDYKQIASRHSISIDTVRGHIRHIYEKLQVHTKSEAVSKALRQHIMLISPRGT